jgi:hypothetical protein
MKGRRALERLRQSPVQHECLAVLSNHDVRWLQIAMHDSPVVRIGHRIAGAYQMLQKIE